MTNTPLTATEIAARHNATLTGPDATGPAPTIAEQDEALTALETAAPAFNDTSPDAAMARLAARAAAPAYSPAPVILPDLTGQPAAPVAGQVPVMAPAPAVQVPARVKVGKLQDTDRLVWLGASHVQKGNSGRYNDWLARAGTFTVQEAVAAGIPGHHIRYVTGQGWARRA